MGAQHKEPKHLKIVLIADLADRTEVSKRLAHLTVIYIQKCIVQPVFCKFLSICSLALGNLIFMVRKYQILSACMDVNLLAQILLRHLGTLNVPSRTSVAPG